MTAVLRVKGDDGRHSEKSIVQHIRDCERIEEIGLKLDIVFLYPMSKLCFFF